MNRNEESLDVPEEITNLPPLVEAAPTVKGTTIYETYLVQWAELLGHVWLFLNTPLGIVGRRIKALFVNKAVKIPHDARRYFATSRRCMGLHGWGRYTEQPIVVLDGLYNIEVEDLLADRIRKEPYAIMGSRAEIMGYIKGLSNKSFDEAKDTEYYRVAKINDFVDSFIRTTVDCKHVFRQWLTTQVQAGKITNIDGYIFRDLNEASIALAGHGNELLQKNCDVQDFLYKYFDSYCIAARSKLVTGYESADELARDLMSKILKDGMGLPQPVIFEPVNGLIRHHQRGSKPKTDEFQLVKGQSDIEHEECNKFHAISDSVRLRHAVS